MPARRTGTSSSDGSSALTTNQSTTAKNSAAALVAEPLGERASEPPSGASAP